MTDKIRNYENIEEALMLAIRMSDRELKEVAASLWPAMPIATAYQRLIDAINPSKNQKLSMHEIIHIMHFCKRYDPLYYLADECLHDRPQKKSIEKEQEDAKEMLDNMYAKLMRAHQDLRVLIQRREKIEKLQKADILTLELNRLTEVS